MHLTVFALVIALNSAFAQVPAQSSQADWPCNRQNGALDGHSPGKGTITSPKIQWSYFAGQRETVFVAERDKDNGQLALSPAPQDTNASEENDPRWGRSGPEGVIAGKSQSSASSSTVVYADIFPDTPGLEKVEFESGFNLPTVNGQWQKAHARCSKWDGTAWQQAWETEPFNLLFLAMPLAGDFDGDGALEIAFLPWNDLILLDAATGKVKYRYRFTEGRSYGFFGAYDLDGDGNTTEPVPQDYLGNPRFVDDADVTAHNALHASSQTKGRERLAGSARPDDSDETRRGFGYCGLVFKRSRHLDSSIHVH